MTDACCLNKSDPNCKINVGQITLLIDRYTAIVGNRRILLTRVEYDMLLLFCRNAGKTFSMDQLAWLVGDRLDPPTDRALRARIAALRRKFGNAAAQIENIRGIGYRLIDRAQITGKPGKDPQ